jgi:hypothetical protein
MMPVLWCDQCRTYHKPDACPVARTVSFRGLDQLSPQELRRVKEQDADMEKMRHIGLV